MAWEGRQRHAKKSGAQLQPQDYCGDEAYLEVMLLMFLMD